MYKTRERPNRTVSVIILIIIIIIKILENYRLVERFARPTHPKSYAGERVSSW
jgi:hypothetical protein